MNKRKEKKERRTTATALVNRLRPSCEKGRKEGVLELRNQPLFKQRQLKEKSSPVAKMNGRGRIHKQSDQPWSRDSLSCSSSG